MHPRSPGKLPAIGWFAILMPLLACLPLAHAGPDDPAPPIVALGNDTYVITRGAKAFFFRDTAKLVVRARADAQEYCHHLGREMKELSVEEIKAGLIIGNFAKARLTFKALAPGDPALADIRSPALSSASTAAPVAPTDVGDLTKLEELHRSGVLTDADFDAARKRLARRSLDDLHTKGVLSDQEYEAALTRLNEGGK
ncbi:MAG TPA: SHOCT domain-containing protein [Candidatus Didemnitutus sp.]|jgi:hypothetical protein